MATDNRGVMVYLPAEVEAKMAEYCTEYNITRKDRQGNIVTSLGSGIVAYLKSQLLGDRPRATSDRPIIGLTKKEVLDLIAESNTNNTPIVGIASLAENRSPDLPDTAILHRLETIDRQLLSVTGLAKDEVEQLIQVSEQRIMEAFHSLRVELRGELAEVKTIDEQVNTAQIETLSTSQDKEMENNVKSPATDLSVSSVTSGTKPITKDVSRWLKPLKDKNFRDIVQAGISDKWSNQEIVTKLFEAGYGKNNNTNPYPDTLVSAMKIAFSIEAENCASV
jgi:hypothetical protein